MDTRLRALRRLSIPQSPEQQIEELYAAYNNAVAETHAWVAECESLMAVVESERERTTALTEQLAFARHDAEHLVEVLANVYTSNARRAADATQRAEELAAAIRELTELRAAYDELRAHDHEVLKRCGDLTSRISSKSALLQERTDELGRALQERDALKHEHGNLLVRFATESALLQERTEELGRVRQERDALKQDCTELGEALRETRSAHAEVADELTQTTERFLAFVNEAHAERRAEVQTLSQLIDEAQQGRAWRIKHFVQRLWRK